jgi:hypothetical protein
MRSQLRMKLNKQPKRSIYRFDMIVQIIQQFQYLIIAIIDRVSVSYSNDILAFIKRGSKFIFDLDFFRQNFSNRMNLCVFYLLFNTRLTHSVDMIYIHFKKCQSNEKDSTN